VSHLLTGDSQAAIDALSRTTALGDSAFLEDAYFYLAKAHLSLRRVEPAIAALRSAAALKGDREAESRQLLGQLESTAK
jgi:tetratricopeptide (TPR) repeat protein